MSKSATTTASTSTTTLTSKAGKSVTLPTPVLSWMSNLVYAPKAEYAAAFAAFLLTGSNEPKAPMKAGVEADWAVKVRVKVKALMTPAKPKKAKKAPAKKAATKVAPAKRTK